ncbi:myo-inositol-1(or 4)-monophosphatase [Saccharopolyspora lacisalsi]|uniref:inositol-phosphate phosphatase n=1 Tax=Halosaccharopolyspora lacisalsi TaxID=1000566 RepID=A0A839E232_9PSEU|nr:inositol monophosphatase [Halosaccharopolyspora lacisalsi]MBA8827130.1 myo-inositol-1(or 4)-monophosphatase [Halosaccharopolyspora lacisalsi]
MTVLSSHSARQEPGLVSRALEVAGKLANDAADVIIETAGRGARPAATESPFDWVTDTGRTLERHTRRILADEFPGIPVFGEEFGEEFGGAGSGETGITPLRWVVDPVDGTANYVAGMPWCAYSLAMLDEHGPIVGVVADPDRGRIHAAARERGMRTNGTPVRLADARETRAGIVCTEFTRTGPWEGMGRFITNAAADQVGVRVLGSPALAITQVALGHATAAVLHSYQEWDVAGALALATEAGATVLDRHGTRSSFPPDGLLVAPPGIAHDAFGWWQHAHEPSAGHVDQ